MLWVDFLPIVFFILKKEKIQDNIHVFLFVLFSFLTQISSFILIKLGHHTITLAFFYNFIASSIVMYFIGFKTMRIKHIFIFYTLFLSVSIFLYFKNLDFYSFLLLSDIVILVFSFWSLPYFLKTNKSIDIITLGFIYSLIVYYSGSLSLFFIIPSLSKINIELWVFHNIIEMISKLIIVYSIWKQPLKSEF